MKLKFWRKEETEEKTEVDFLKEKQDEVKKQILSQFFAELQDIINDPENAVYTFGHSIVGQGVALQLKTPNFTATEWRDRDLNSGRWDSKHWKITTNISSEFEYKLTERWDRELNQPEPPENVVGIQLIEEFYEVYRVQEEKQRLEELTELSEKILDGVYPPAEEEYWDILYFTALENKK